MAQLHCRKGSLMLYYLHRKSIDVLGYSAAKDPQEPPSTRDLKSAEVPGGLMVDALKLPSSR